jgi:hypothetical protein
LFLNQKSAKRRTAFSFALILHKNEARRFKYAQYTDYLYRKRKDNASLKAKRIVVEAMSTPSPRKKCAAAAAAAAAADEEMTVPMSPAVKVAVLKCLEALHSKELEALIITRDAITVSLRLCNKNYSVFAFSSISFLPVFTHSHICVLMCRTLLRPFVTPC